MTSSLAAGQGPAIGAIEIYAKCFTVEEAVQSLKNTKRIGWTLPFNAIYIEFSHKKWWFSIVMLVYQRVS